MTDRFILFESISRTENGAVNKTGDNFVNKWFVRLHPTHPADPITESEVLDLIRDIYTKNVIQDIVNKFTKSYAGCTYYTSIKDDIDCKKEVIIDPCLDLYYVTSLAYRFPRNSQILDFVVDYLARVYELDNDYGYSSYNAYLDIFLAIIVSYDKFAPADDTTTMRKLIELLKDRVIDFYGYYHDAIIYLYASYNENDTYGRHIMSRNITEFMFKIAVDEGIQMSDYTQGIMDHAYMVLNMEKDPYHLNELQLLIVKVFLFIYGDGDIYDTDEFKAVLKDAYLNCAPKSYIDKLNKHIDNDDWRAILDDLEQICRTYMLQNDHYIVLDEDYLEGTIAHRASCEHTELLTMSTEDEQDILEDIQADVKLLITRVIKPFNFDI